MLTYSGVTIANALDTYKNSQEGRRISLDSKNSAELRDAAREYADSELELLSFPQVLNPLAYGKPKPYEVNFRLKKQPKVEKAVEGL